MKPLRMLALFLLSCLLCAGARASVLAQTPLFVSNIAPPMNMLVVGRDQKLYFPAYNDASDIDGDGQLDIYYKPSIDYTGYFDSYKCYSYDDSNGVFVPASTTSTKKCSGKWSGDFLNYLTMSRIDVLRKVLYGGYRYEDTTSSTVLERQFIPNDAHTWGKEYLSVARDGYNIADYSPLTAPSNGKYILFANTSRPSSGNTITSYTDGAVPKLRIINSTQQGSNNYRIWGWVSREVAQGTNAITSADTSRTDTSITPQYDLTVRVKVCVSGLLESNCTAYGSSNKPTGLLHDYAASNKMYFGLLTGTYTNNLQGGALRRAPTSSFTSEYDSSGRFLTSSASNNNSKRTYVDGSGIVANLDRLIYTDVCSSAYKATFSNGDCLDWGNPLGEMAYEALRYYAGLTPFSSYASGSKDTSLGLTSLSSWSNPYNTYPYCTKPYMTLVSDVNPSYDSDVPGGTLGSSPIPSEKINGFTFDFSKIGATLWNAEIGKSVSVNIGQSGSTSDSAPTAKTASSFSTIRGLPEEPTRQGSYSTAAVTYFGSQNGLSATGSHPVQSFSVALSSTLPNIQVPVNSSTVTFKPYGMVADSSGIVMQITGFYIDSMANTSSANLDSSINGGRPYYKFRVVYDDAGQNADFDMDSIILYTVQLGADGRVSVTSENEYSVSGSESHMGYTIAGTTKDGIYLEVAGGVGGTSGTASSTPTRFKFDTPEGTDAGGCVSNTNSCSRLPGRSGGNKALSAGSSHTRYFTASSSTAVTTLQDPLWYAAKYGKSDLSTWDTDGDGTPDNYFLVSNPSKLASQLKSAFDDILQLNASVTAVAVDSQSLDDGDYVYSTNFSSSDWTGDLIKKQKIKTTSSSGATSTTTTTLWKASAQLPSSRNIYFAKNGSLTSFTWANLSSAQQTALNRTAAGVVDSKGSTRVDFLRGSNTSFRSRSSLLGDIVNSSPVLVSGADYITARADALEGSTSYAAYASEQAAKPAAVYVGANDGMLHAFNASTGAELFAFIPSAVIANLNILTASDYGQDEGTEHRYFVDGTPVVADVYYGSAWHKVLLGSLGAGGREVFALDITDPASPSLLWEFTSDNDASLGYTAAKPSIARLHDGKWVALVPNGYESGSNSASLLIIDIQSGTLLKKITATPSLTTTDTGALDSLANGLSRLYVADVNSDGIADYAYAGDLLGDLWRFDLIDTSASSPLTASAADAKFAVAFGGNPLYVARNASNVRQPITAAPSLVEHPSGTGYIVAFGTGRYLTTSDKTSTATQSVYGIWDRKTAGEATSASLTAARTRSDLQQQTLTAGTTDGTTTYTLSEGDVAWYDSSGNTADANVATWGWYFDFPRTGERLIYDMTLYGSSLIFASSTPQTGTCAAGLSGTVYAVDPESGGKTDYNVFDLNSDGTYESISGFVTDGGDITLSGGYTWGNSENTLDGVATNTGTVSGRRSWQVLPSDSN
ncbi:pilus assembly protein [Pseudomonas citronellolis]|uniref:pilus assembly protein n=1 Tax=Pseudomonas citronellolis TaxID=53408 RepID=UPI002D7952C7|nr:PilC/PilY family type IV pilus protein [Pseudomonas citronellolis]WRT82397.1 PilC/PilY family type IV pilus protein [Pseudomonas citronellolis]